MAKVGRVEVDGAANEASAGHQGRRDCGLAGSRFVAGGAAAQLLWPTRGGRLPLLVRNASKRACLPGQ
jgi:hypothetical protein